MKKKIIIVSLFAGLWLMATALTGSFRQQQPVNKEISVAISSNNNYTSAAYSDAKASVHVIITRVNGSKHTIVSDQTYDNLQLQDIPGESNAISRNVTIPNVFNDKEKLIITYTISYDSRGSIIRFCNGQTASENEDREKITINI